MAVSFPRTFTVIIDVPTNLVDEFGDPTTEATFTLTLEEFNLGEDGEVIVTGITSKAVRLGGTASDSGGNPASSVTPGHGSKLTVYRQGDARN